MGGTSSRERSPTRPAANQCLKVYPCIPGNMQGRRWNFWRGYIMNLTDVKVKEHSGAVWRHRDPILPVVDKSSAANDGGHELERKVGLNGKGRIVASPSFAQGLSA